MGSAISAVFGVLVSMGMKLIGYEFITRTLIISLKAWAETTETKHDDAIVRSMADAWGVPYGDVKKLLKD
jgi:hypothetical protein